MTSSLEHKDLALLWRLAVGRFGSLLVPLAGRFCHSCVLYHFGMMSSASSQAWRWPGRLYFWRDQSLFCCSYLDKSTMCRDASWCCF